MVVRGILKHASKHRLHSPVEKCMIESMKLYFKDRKECFDVYYPLYIQQQTTNNKQQKYCDLQYVYN